MVRPLHLVVAWPLFLAISAPAASGEDALGDLVSRVPTIGRAADNPARGHSGDRPSIMDCPVPLLNISEDGQTFDLLDLGLSYLERLPSPLYIVPILGVYRGGKSFFMNRCQGLRTPYVQGFGVGHGQESHTRGIDVCAEQVVGLGTVVWMDTEGLFSSVYAHSPYGTKLFSLALLFSSAVLLNSVKVLDDQFFSFFSEQQQVARVLRRGLAEEGLPEGDFLPRNLSIVWVLQQPVGYDGNQWELQAQLESFLSGTGDEARERMHREFNHTLHVIPTVSNDYRLWGVLDTAPEEALTPAYNDAVIELRGRLLSKLHSARPMQAEAVAKQLMMYTQLVQTEQFSGKLVREALEESELGARCAEFARALFESLGELPTRQLVSISSSRRAEAQVRAAEAADLFHFGREWEVRFEHCLDRHIDDLLHRNDERVFDVWQTKATSIAEGQECFFLDQLVAFRDELFKEYGLTLNSELRERSVHFATTLQRARLVECLKVKHLLLPLAPWVAWPIISSYIRSGTVSGLALLSMHTVAVIGVYVLLSSFKQLPPYLDADYPVLRARPQTIDWLLMVLPWAPWHKLAIGFAVMGCCWCVAKLLRAIADKWRPAGDQIGGMVNLELKLNVMLRRSEVELQQKFLVALQDASTSLESHREREAVISLMRGLCIFRNISGEDPQMTAIADVRLRRRINKILENRRLLVQAPGLRKAWCSCDILGCALRAELTDALYMVVELLESLGDASGSG